MRAPAIAKAVLVALLVSLPAGARADFADAVRAYEAGDYATAYAEWLPFAERGDPAAERNIGHLYRMGWSVPQDFSEAAKWYRRAAEKGFARAQANLANMYLRGQGLERDHAMAVEWFRRAGLQGHAVAQYNLGLMYENGLGVEQSDAKAMGWYHLASRTGHRRASDKLALLIAKSTSELGALIEVPVVETATVADTTTEDAAGFGEAPIAPAEEPAEMAVIEPSEPVETAVLEPLEPAETSATEAEQRLETADIALPEPEPAGMAALEPVATALAVEEEPVATADIAVLEPEPAAAIEAPAPEGPRRDPVEVVLDERGSDPDANAAVEFAAVEPPVGDPGVGSRELETATAPAPAPALEADATDQEAGSADQGGSGLDPSAPDVAPQAEEGPEPAVPSEPVETAPVEEEELSFFTAFLKALAGSTRREREGLIDGRASEETDKVPAATEAAAGGGDGDIAAAPREGEGLDTAAEETTGAADAIEVEPDGLAGPTNESAAPQEAIVLEAAAAPFEPNLDGPATTSEAVVALTTEELDEAEPEPGDGVLDAAAAPLVPNLDTPAATSEAVVALTTEELDEAELEPEDGVLAAAAAPLDTDLDGPATTSETVVSQTAEELDEAELEPEDGVLVAAAAPLDMDLDEPATTSEAMVALTAEKLDEAEPEPEEGVLEAAAASLDAGMDTPTTTSEAVVALTAEKLDEAEPEPEDGVLVAVAAPLDTDLDGPATTSETVVALTAVELDEAELEPEDGVLVAAAAPPDTDLDRLATTSETVVALTAEELDEAEPEPEEGVLVAAAAPLDTDLDGPATTSETAPPLSADEFDTGAPVVDAEEQEGSSFFTAFLKVLKGSNRSEREGRAEAESTNGGDDRDVEPAMNPAAQGPGDAVATAVETAALGPEPGDVQDEGPAASAVEEDDFAGLALDALRGEAQAVDEISGAADEGSIDEAAAKAEPSAGEPAIDWNEPGSPETAPTLAALTMGEESGDSDETSLPLDSAGTTEGGPAEAGADTEALVAVTGAEEGEATGAEPRIDWRRAGEPPIAAADQTAAAEPGPPVEVAARADSDAAVPVVATALGAAADLDGLSDTERLSAGLAAYRARDYAGAVTAWLPLAERGDRMAQFYVGGLYLDGTGLPASRVWAHVFWTLAAEQGQETAAGLLAVLTADMLPVERAEARDLAAAWRPRS